MADLKLGVVLLMIVILAVVVEGCKGEGGGASGEGVEKGYADVVLKVEPEPPVVLKDAEFTVEVTDENGAPMTGAEVVVDLSMPGMYHGENRQTAGEVSSGVYRTRGVFTMAGKWLVRVEVRAEGVNVTKSFNTEAVGG